MTKTFPTISKSWAPSSWEEIEGKARLYSTARVVETSECVGLLSTRQSTQEFECRTSAGIRWMKWDKLDSFCL